MTKGTTTTTFGYDSEHQRTIETVGTTKKLIFLSPRIDAGVHFEVETTNGKVENKHTIYARGAPVAQYTTKSDSTNETVYYHKDHLGSIVAISNSSGAAIAKYWYDAWGKRVVLSGGTDYTHHGFTGHQQLDDYGLIHMNGRIYDPVIGRFQTADPNVFYPESTQGFNRYSYVDNNPLSYTDPSGFRTIFDAAWDDIKSKNWTVDGVTQLVIGAVWMTVGVILTPLNPVLGPIIFATGMAMAGQGACDIGMTCQVRDKALENGISVSVPISAGGSGGGSSSSSSGGSGGSGSVAGGGVSDAMADAGQELRAVYERERDWYYKSMAEMHYGIDIPATEAHLYADGTLAMGFFPPALAAAEALALNSAARAAATAAAAKGIAKVYKRPSGATTAKQRAAVQGKTCVDCGALTPKQVADHKTPLVKCSAPHSHHNFSQIPHRTI